MNSSWPLRPRLIDNRGEPDQIPEQIRDAVQLVEQKATPEELRIPQFVLRLADVVAHATRRARSRHRCKEVSEDEQAALDRLSSTLSAQ